MSAYANVLILKIKEKFDYKNNYENSSRSLDKNDLKNILQSHMFVKNCCLSSISGQTTFYGRIQATMLMVFFPDLVSTKRSHMKTETFVERK